METPPVTASSLLAAFSPRRTPLSLTNEKRMSTIETSLVISSTEAGPAHSPQTNEIDAPKTPSLVSDDEWHNSTPDTPWSDADIRSAQRLNRFASASHLESQDDIKVEDYQMSSVRNSDRTLRPRTSLKTYRLGISNTSRKAMKKGSPKSPINRKLLRQKPQIQIRTDIGADTRFRRNNFLQCHRSAFLPLLPIQNYISNLGQEGLLGYDKVEATPFKLIQSQPAGIRAILKDYQMTGLSFLVWLHRNGASGILGDEMGLGKTLQTLSLFQYLEVESGPRALHEELRPYLVVCPLSVVGSWINEARKWTPDLGVLRFHGSRQERAQLKGMAVGAFDRFGNQSSAARARKRGQPVTESSFSALAGPGPYRLIVTSYESFAAEQRWFKTAFSWKYIVLDEGHRIKNELTQIFNALQGLRAEHRLILTGTPLQNNMLEMWALLHWLYPDVFTVDTGDLFRTSFDLSRGMVSTSVIDDTRRLLELICLRRLKESPTVGLGLPPKTEVLLYAPLTPFQRLWYTRVLTRSNNNMLAVLSPDPNVEEQAIQAIPAPTNFASDLRLRSAVSYEGAGMEQWSAAHAVLCDSVQKEMADGASKSLWQRLMNLIMQLRKVCSHPYLLSDAAPEPYIFGEHVILASAKYIMLQKLIRELVLKQGKNADILWLHWEPQPH